jgi:hypothetical protein
MSTLSYLVLLIYAIVVISLAWWPWNVWLLVLGVYCGRPLKLGQRNISRIKQER